MPIGDLVNHLLVGLHHAAVYFREHPRVAESAAEFARRLEEGLGAAEQDTLFLGIVRGRLVCEGRPLLGPSLIAKRLVEASTRLRCGGFLFERGASAAEIGELLRACVERGPGPADIEEARRLLVSRGIFRVRLSAAHGEKGWLGGDLEEEAKDRAQPGRDVVAQYQTLFGAVEASHAAAGRDGVPDVGAARGAAEGIVPAMGDDPASLMRLSRYPDSDFYSVGHSVRVALLAVLVAKRLGLPDAAVAEIGTAGLLHDVGKGFVPQEVLLKRGPLDDEERRQMALHPTLGAQALLRSPDASPLAIAAAYGHHLRHDRAGYPKLRAWGAAGRIAALFQVCDVFEALTAVRPYKPMLAPRDAYRLMLRDPGAYDPSAFAAFVAAVGFHPPGTRVGLKGGAQGVVLRAGEHPAFPVVRLTHGAGGFPLPYGADGDDDAVIVDLASAPEFSDPDASVDDVARSPIVGHLPDAPHDARESVAAPDEDAVAAAHRALPDVLRGAGVCPMSVDPHGHAHD